MTGSYYLTVVGGQNAGKRYALSEGQSCLVGRGEGCDIRLSDPSVSRVHLRISLVDGRVHLEDTGSRWGTLVNRIRAENQELFPGDAIEVGDTELRLDVESPLVTTIAPNRRRVLGTVNDLIDRHRLEDTDCGQFASSEEPPEDSPSDELLPEKRPHQAIVASTNLEALVGEEFLEYRIESIVARPPSGMIFRAYDPRHHRAVALKIFRPDFFNTQGTVERFLRAMRTTISLSHKNIVRLYAAGQTRQLCFTASEFVDGESVSQLIRRIGVAGMLDWRTALHVAAGVAEALEFSQDHKILHRNICPSNILLRATDRCVKLGDLMLAKALDETGGECITRAGEVVGDLRYLSPEQLSGEQQVDIRADIYSLGATLYAILTGHAPFEGNTPAEVIRRIVLGSPEPPTRVHLSIPSLLEGLVLQMLSKRPEDRPQSATRLRQEVERISRYCNLPLRS